MSDSALKQLVIHPFPDCDPLIGAWLGAFQDARNRTSEALDGLSPKAVDWQDACSPHTIGTLLYHIAAIEADWLFTEVLEREFSPEIAALLPYDVRDSEGNLTHVEGETLEELWERLRMIRQTLLDAYRQMSLEEFRRARVLPKYEVTPEWVLHHLGQHEAEHRSELITLRAHFQEDK
jgi:uncharacterized damage-inducible protein DinB